MSPDMPGLRVGPLDPDRTQEFGQVAQQNSARQLVRLHSQMYPPHLRAALARPLDESHTKAASEHLDAVAEYGRRLQHDNGDPVLAEGAEVVGAAVRGEHPRQVITLAYRLPSGRIGKWFAPYSRDRLPEVHEVGTRYAQVRAMKERGVVAFDEGGAGMEISQRQLARSRAENERLREALEGRSERGADDITVAAADVPSDAAQLEELEQLRRENAEQRERLARYEQHAGAGGGGVPTEGLEADIPGGAGQAASQDPPFGDYEALKADQVVERLKADDTSREDREAILAYERAHANRKSVVSAAEQTLDRPSG